VRVLDIPYIHVFDKKAGYSDIVGILYERL
jgi:hypothetical protein